MMEDPGQASEGQIGRQAISDQLERMLQHPLFCHSKRYPALLQAIVERTLAGRTEALRERSLGVEVFGRAPDYDSGNDPVVRITAGEIRKRIAQYYQLPEHADQLRILLPSGAYVPEFQLPEPAINTAPPAAVTMEPQPVPSTFWGRRVPAAYALVAVALLGAVGFLGWQLRAELRQPSAMVRFWAPIVGSNGPVRMCLGREPSASNNSSRAVPLSDSRTAAKIASLLGETGKAHLLDGEASTSFADLRSGPSVIIGGFNNPWTMRLMKKMRFFFEKDGDLRLIRDRHDPSGPGWGYNRSMPSEDVQNDFALISRLWDPTTGTMTLLAGGIRRFGTDAAGEFLTEPEYLEQFAAEVGPGWENKSIQIVISSDIIDGNSGPPRIVATHIW